jgi:undecaprenyl-diphosphatase
MAWIEALVLGLVQGITEFLPVSSDGHLLVTQSFFAWLTGQSRTGKENLFFDIILHLGTTAAILVYHRQSIVRGWSGLSGASEISPGFHRSEVVHVGVLAAVATAPLVPFALYLKKPLESTFEGTTWAGCGFLVTAAVLGVTAWLGRRDGARGPSNTHWWHALAIGIAQLFAPLPGVSRSGVTIATALALGFSRTWAVNFSLLIAVPAVLGAVVLAIKDVKPSMLTFDRVGPALAGTLVAAIVGYFAIIWLTRVVRSGRIWCFSLYLVLLALVVLSIAARG